MQDSYAATKYALDLLLNQTLGSGLDCLRLQGERCRAGVGILLKCSSENEAVAAGEEGSHRVSGLGVLEKDSWTRALLLTAQTSTLVQVSHGTHVEMKLP